MHKLKLILIIFIIVATIVTCINPVYPHEQFLQHAGTLLLLIPLFVDLRHDHMPMSAFAETSLCDSIYKQPYRSVLR
jgi:putative membrane protein